MKLTDGLSLPNPNPVILPLLPNQLRAALCLLHICILKPSIASKLLAQQREVVHRVAYPVEVNRLRSDNAVNNLWNHH